MADYALPRSFWPAESLMPREVAGVCKACGHRWQPDGSSVRELRRFRGWSQGRLAAAVTAYGVPCTRADICNLELGRYHHRFTQRWAAAAIAVMTAEDEA